MELKIKCYLPDKKVIKEIVKDMKDIKRTDYAFFISDELTEMDLLHEMPERGFTHPDITSLFTMEISKTEDLQEMLDELFRNYGGMLDEGNMKIFLHTSYHTKAPDFNKYNHCYGLTIYYYNQTK